MKPYQSKNSETSIESTGVEIASHLLGTMFPAGKYRAAAPRALLRCLNSIDSTYWALPQPDKCTLLVTVQRILPIKAPMLLGCKPCTCLLMAKDFHSWCVLVNIFLCSGLTDCEMSGVRWELGSVSDGLGERAVSIKHINQKKRGFFFFQLWLVVLPPTYRISSAASANSDSKTRMLLVVKNFQSIALAFLFCFSCSARGLILWHYICLLCIYLFHLYSFLL